MVRIASVNCFKNAHKNSSNWKLSLVLKLHYSFNHEKTIINSIDEFIDLHLFSKSQHVELVRSSNFDYKIVRNIAYE